MFNNLLIKTRLLLLVGMMSFALLLVCLFGLYGLRQTIRGIDDVYHGGSDSVEHLAHISALYATDVNGFWHRLIEVSEAKGDLISMASLNKTFSEIDRQWQFYSATDQTPLQKMLFDKLQSSAEKLHEKIYRLIGLAKESNSNVLISFAYNEIAPEQEAIIKSIDDLIQDHVRKTQKDYKEAIAEATFITYTSLLLTFLIIISAFFTARWLIKTISEPLAFTVSSIDRLSNGNTALQLYYSSQDEIGQVVSALKRMVDSFQEMIHALVKVSKGDLSANVNVRSTTDDLALAINEMVRSSKEMIHTLAKVSQGDLTGGVQIRSDKDLLGKAINQMIMRLTQMISEIHEEISVLTSSSQEIMASVSQVSAGSSETAAAVTETTTTAEELKQTAQISAEKAKDVLANAEETQNVVKASEGAVAATIEDMQQIEEKMRIISDGIIKLSEHSLAIGEIIDTVDGLAEQSNLLAVNAAIEAAKAGDQGKSFGVVAQEIRALAEQSKGATVQIRAILSDIQNSTSSAVMATEQGSKAVVKGVAQSLQASHFMQSLTSSISQVTQAAKQISIASQQQLVAIEQITCAMANINVGTGQHVEHMKQIEGAIISLNEVGRKLLYLIGQYKLKANESGSIKKKQFFSRGLTNFKSLKKIKS